MDKISSPLHLRQGFALMVTLSVLSVVIALTVVLLGYFTEVKKDADRTQALIQADVFYADILAQFSKFKDKKALFKHLYHFPVSLYAQKGRFSMMLKCEPLSTGVNINWLKYAQDTQHQHLFKEVDTLLDLLIQRYSIEDGGRLRDLLMQQMSPTQQYISKSQSRLRQKNGIISYKEFMRIVHKYQMEVDDTQVALVPWKSYFSFSETSTKIDIEYSSAELISMLFDIDLNSVKDWYNAPNKGSVKNFVLDNGGDYMAKKDMMSDGTFLAESICTVHYGEGYKFTFEYIDGKAKYFELYE